VEGLTAESGCPLGTAEGANAVGEAVARRHKASIVMKGMIWNRWGLRDIAKKGVYDL
jgi:hypothetical protein